MPKKLLAQLGPVILGDSFVFRMADTVGEQLLRRSRCRLLRVKSLQWSGSSLDMLTTWLCAILREEIS